MWTEKILLLLNREDDPTDILTRMNSDDVIGSGMNSDFPITNSVHKVKLYFLTSMRSQVNCKKIV